MPSLSGPAYPSNTNVTSVGNTLRGNPLEIGNAPNIPPNFAVVPGQFDKTLNGLAGATAYTGYNPFRSVTGQTVAELVDTATPVVIQQTIIKSMQNYGAEHLRICPLFFDADQKYLPGVSMSTLVYNNDVLPVQQEKTAPRMIRFTRSAVYMKLKRRGIAFEIPGDYDITEQGRNEYRTKMQVIINDAGLTARVAAMSAMLRSSRPRATLMRKYGVTKGYTLAQLNEANMNFGVLQKQAEGIRRLLDRGRKAAIQASMPGTFTHLFMAPNAIAAVRHNVHRKNYSEFGPGNRDLIDNPDSLRTIDGIKLVQEEPVSLETIKGEDLQLLEQKVKVGLWFLSNLENIGEKPQGLRAGDLSTIDFERGEGQIVTQKLRELIYHAQCWDPATGRLDAFYGELSKGNNADALAKEFNVPTDARNSEGRSSTTKVFDPWLIDSGRGVKPVHIVGNSDREYLDFECIAIIARFAQKALDESEWEPSHYSAMVNVINFLKTNKSPSNLLYANAFAMATAKGDGYNDHGVRKIPGIFDVLGCAIWIKENPRRKEDGGDDGSPRPSPRNNNGGGVMETGKLGDTEVPENVVDFEEVEEEEEEEKEEQRTKVPSGAPYDNTTYPIGVKDKIGDVNDRYLQRLSDNEKDELFPESGLFPGCSQIKHLRTLAHFFKTEESATWSRALEILRPGFTKEYNELKRVVSKGLAALETFARIMQRYFSVDDMYARNIMFRPDSLPLWSRGKDQRTNAIDAMIDNLVIGIDFPVGFNDSIVANGDTVGVIDDRSKLAERVIKALPDAFHKVGEASYLEIFEVMNGTQSIMKEFGSDGIDNKKQAKQVTASVTEVIDGSESAWDIAIHKLNQVDVELHDDTENYIRALSSVLATLHNSPVTTREEAEHIGTKAARLIGIQRARHIGANSAPRRRLDSRDAHNEGDRHVYMFAVIPTGLVFSPEFLLVNRAGYIVPSDPVAPNRQWIHGQNVGLYEDTLEELARHSDSAFSLDYTVFGGNTNGMFGGGNNDLKRSRDGAMMRQGARKRRYGDTTRPSGATYGMAMEQDDSTIPSRDAFLRDQPGRGTSTGVEDLFVVECNAFFKGLWEDVKKNTGDIVKRVLHWLVLTQRVHRDAFVNMVDHGIPAPMSILALNPQIMLKMTHAVFAQANCGHTYYALPRIDAEKDAMHKIIRVSLTVWIEALVEQPNKVFVAENVAFDGYISGGGTRLVRTVAKRINDAAAFLNTRTRQVVDYDPHNIDQRKGDRICMHVGARCKFTDVPSTVSLSGGYGTQGAYRGDGSFILPDIRRSCPSYDSALAGCVKLGFGTLNEPGLFNDLTSKRDQCRGFGLRKRDVCRANNTVCHKGDQFLPDQNGALTVHDQHGDGLLGILYPGVVRILHGTDGRNIADLAEAHY